MACRFRSASPGVLAWDLCRRRRGKAPLALNPKPQTLNPTPLASHAKAEQVAVAAVAVASVVVVVG